MSANTSTSCSVICVLCDAVCAGDLVKVKEFVTAYGLPNIVGRSRGFTQLCDAVEFGHIDIAKFLIEAGASVNPEKGNVDTPLHFAVMTGNVELVQMLLSNGALVNATNDSKETPLHAAVESGNVNLVWLLLNEGALSLADKSEFEPLHIACFREMANIVEILLRHRTESKAPQSMQSLSIALMLGAQSGNRQIVSWLLKASADPNYVLTSRLNHHRHTCSLDIGSSPLFIACQEHFENIVELLLERGVEVNCSRSGDHFTPLHVASTKCLKITSLLLNNSADPNAEAHGSITPLHLAAENGHWKIVKLLLNKAVDVNARTESGATPLLLAVENGHERVVKLLLGWGAFVNAKDKSNNSPLYLAIQKKKMSLVNCILEHQPYIDKKVDESLPHCGNGCNEIADSINEYIFTIKYGNLSDFDLLPIAVKEGQLKIVKNLLARGADLNDKRYDLSLLHCAVESGQVEVVKTLIKLGCDVNCRKQNVTPISLLFCHDERSKYLKIVQILVAHGADLKLAPDLLHGAIGAACIEVCTFLIENGADVNLPLEDGYTPLHLIALTRWKDGQCLEKAVEADRIEIAKLLLTNGAEVNSKNDHGSTTLHLAVRNGWSQLTLVLIEFKADVNALDKDSYTPLHYAVQSQREIVTELLLQNGAQVDTPLKEGRQTSLHMAAYKGNAEIVRLILNFGADINAKDAWGNTALHFAVLQSELSVVKILLENDCNVHIQNDFGSTALGLIVPGDCQCDGRYYIETYDNICWSSAEQDSTVWNRCRKHHEKGEGTQDEIINVIVTHVIKFKTAGMFTTTKTENDVLIHYMGWDRDLKYKRFEEACKEEIKRLKSCELRIYYSSQYLTLYDILRNCTKPLSVKSKCKMRTLESLCLNRFPIYGNTIENWYRRFIKNGKDFETEAK